MSEEAVLQNPGAGWSLRLGERRSALFHAAIQRIALRVRDAVEDERIEHISEFDAFKPRDLFDVAVQHAHERFFVLSRFHYVEQRSRKELGFRIRFAEPAKPLIYLLDLRSRWYVDAAPT